MFEIGSSLREARVRRELQLAEVERETRIRTRWLRALEQERFDLLPARAYAKGFLRTYADYLGLDGQQFVDELSARLPPEDELEGSLPPPRPVRRRRTPRPISLAGVGVAVVATAIVIWLVGVGSTKPHAPARPPPPVRSVTPPPVSPPSNRRTKPSVARLVLAATRGRCWLDARLGSQGGKELHMGTLELGQSLRLSGKQIWIRLGAPTTLDATLNGKPVSLPSATPVNVVVTPAGVRAVA